jgi:hypothetical protein
MLSGDFSEMVLTRSAKYRLTDGMSQLFLTRKAMRLVR